MLRTKFTELVGCTVPIQQAGMGDLSPPRLAAAVADAGALGMVGLTSAPLAYVVKSLDETRHLTSGIFGANFIYPGLVDETTGQVDPEFAGVVEAAASRASVSLKGGSSCPPAKSVTFAASARGRSDRATPSHNS